MSARLVVSIAALAVLLSSEPKPVSIQIEPARIAVTGWTLPDATPRSGWDSLLIVYTGESSGQQVLGHTR